MVIGIVTTWFERGAAYVSRIYKNLLEKEGHKVYIFARGGENYSLKEKCIWNEDYVTRSSKYIDTTIEKRKLYSWIKKYSLEAILFNEQQDFRVLIWLKQDFPKIKLGAYVDYYTEYTLPWFDLYDFLICNTRRHMQAMVAHPQKYFMPWGTDIDVFKPLNEKHDILTFFHSTGVSTRKGTDILIEAFIKGEVYKKAKLVIHTQLSIERVCKYTKNELANYNINIIEKTVTAPGLYYMGDVYIYPTRLDGLGLTMYEAISSGMPMITSDFPPMNEVGIDSFVRKVKIADYYCRGDAYYYPMVICDKDNLIEAMMWYVNHQDELEKQKKLARLYAEKNYNIMDRSTYVSNIFITAQCRKMDSTIVELVRKEYSKNWNFIKILMKRRKIYNFIHKK